MQLASDVVHDGLGLELLCEGERVVAEVFRSDATHTVTLHVFESVPDEVLREFVEHARKALHPFEDGSPLPTTFDIGPAGSPVR